MKLLQFFIRTIQATFLPLGLSGAGKDSNIHITVNGTKAIETLRVGDLVLSKSDEHSAVGFKPVMGLKITPEQLIYRLTVKNEVGEVDEINTTAEHPFWVQGCGWLKAQFLETGMLLVDEHGNNVWVETLEQTQRNETVYNIEVEDWNTYFVGQLAVWVHNACLPSDAKKMTDKQLADYFGDKNWHENGAKSNLIKGYLKDLKGSKNADLYIDKTTGKAYLIGNKSSAVVEIK